MIKILMIQPENRELNRFRRLQFNNFSQITIPYLAAFVDERFYKITLIDEYCQKIPFHQSFDLVVITVNTPNAPHCYKISSVFRKKGASVVLGGPHVTLLPNEALEHCDHLLVGEGETIWPRFLADYWLQKAKRVYKSEAVPDLAHTPAPRWDLLHRSHIMKGAIFATRGCPYHCRYCNLKQIYHPCFRKRPIDEVVQEIKAMKSKFFVFWDDNLFADKKHAIALLRAIAPLKLKWAAQATLRDCNDSELLQTAKKAGCLYLFVGLETFSEESLISAGKPVNRLEDYRPVIEKIHSHGIMIQAGIIFGFDSDKKSVFDCTLSACEQLGVDGVTVSILTPFPKTPVYEQFKAEGRLLTDDWSRYNSKTAVVFQPKNMSPDELLAGYKRFRRQFYTLRSFIKRMKVSSTNVAMNFIINLGYRLGIR